MEWLILLGAILAEVAGTSSLRAVTLSGACWAWWLAVVAGYVAAFGLFAVALARGLPLGAGYAIWAGVGVALTALVAWVVFGERPGRWMLVGFVLIIAGVVLIEATGRHTTGGAGA